MLGLLVHVNKVTTWVDIDLRGGLVADENAIDCPCTDPIDHELDLEGNPFDLLGGKPFEDRMLSDALLHRHLTILVSLHNLLHQQIASKDDLKFKGSL